MFANYVLNDYVKWKQFGRVNRIVLDLLPLHSALFCLSFYNDYTS